MAGRSTCPVGRRCVGPGGLEVARPSQERAGPGSQRTRRVSTGEYGHARVAVEDVRETDRSQVRTPPVFHRVDAGRRYRLLRFRLRAQYPAPGPRMKARHYIQTGEPGPRQESACSPSRAAGRSCWGTPVLGVSASRSGQAWTATATAVANGLLEAGATAAGSTGPPSELCRVRTRFPPSAPPVTTPAAQ
jgi:hypothetical protein